MRFLILLLSSAAAISVVSAYWMETEFPATVLKPDLDVLMKYYRKGNKGLMAYIHWPNSVTFVVQWIEDKSLGEAYLKVYGAFHIKKLFFGPSFEGLFLKTDGKFYYKKKKSNKMIALPPHQILTYSALPVRADRISYLSIRYFSLEEIQSKAAVIYSANKYHFQIVLGKYPAIFMVTPQGSEGMFLEYTYSCEVNVPMSSDLMVRVLIGTAKGNKRKITNNIIASTLVYDEEKSMFTIPEAYFLNTDHLKNVFGVRMMNTVFLAKVEDSQNKRLFSENDLVYVLPKTPEIPYISKQDLLKKAQHVEPRLKYDVPYTPLTWPNSIQFQVKGVIFRKNVNLCDGKICDICPFSIKSLSKESFLFENNLVEKLCTDDNDLWKPVD